MQIDAIHQIVEDDLKKTEQLVINSLRSPISLITDLSAHIIQSGGKRVRPLLVLLVAKALGYKGELHIYLAAIVELIHTATLLHDDVVDDSLLRRGKGTANAIWGNQASVLVGDYLYSHAFQLMVGMNQMLIMDILAKSTNAIVQGEILQLMNAHKPEITEEDYLEVIRCKTGKLFQTSAILGAIIADCSEEQKTAFAEFGMHLGVAFQIIDDMLDYRSDSEKIGKNRGDDLAEGKSTLPLIQALKKCSPQEAELIHKSILAGNFSHLGDILRIIETTQSIEYTHQFAEQTILKALSCLNAVPDSPYKEALGNLAKFVVSREY